MTPPYLIFTHRWDRSCTGLYTGLARDFEQDRFYLNLRKVSFPLCLSLMAEFFSYDKFDDRLQFPNSFSGLHLDLRGHGHQRYSRKKKFKSTKICINIIPLSGSKTGNQLIDLQLAVVMVAKCSAQGVRQLKYLWLLHQSFLIPTTQRYINPFYDFTINHYITSPGMAFKTFSRIDTPL